MTHLILSHNMKVIILCPVESLMSSYWGAGDPPQIEASGLGLSEKYCKKITTKNSLKFYIDLQGEVTLRLGMISSEQPNLPKLVLDGFRRH